ncbi:hypothetical protein A1OE_1454 [Candidatus Endolissoclinum faulkneri L2]|uniref:Uncharacterized protein n=1 Tax=Candidatus Endolissoclinum faulkneri L2 TaxID=1193729 RepID=K7Z639_9PROT|nr:hypothetical protein A1OE_1454 [Candidatus Endolissoclinum faulkneri L2]
MLITNSLILNLLSSFYLYKTINQLTIGWEILLFTCLNFIFT